MKRKELPKMCKKKIITVFALTIFVLIMGAVCVFAAPAYTGPFNVTNENGKTLTVYGTGDEYESAFTDGDGNVLDISGNEILNGEAGNTAEISEGELELFQDPEEEKGIAVQTVPQYFSSASLQAGEAKQTKLLAVLVSFADIEIGQYHKNSGKYTEDDVVMTDAYWNTFFFASNKISVYSYYKEVSNGKHMYIPASETYGNVNDGIVRVTLPINHPEPYKNGTDGENSYLEIAKLAMDLTDEYVNYASYDTNGDGYISNDELSIVFVTAGFEASYNQYKNMSVWARNWCMTEAHAGHSEYLVTLDGKKLLMAPTDGDESKKQNFAIHGEYYIYLDSETNKTTVRRCGVGIICHELGHSLGLFDLYDNSNLSAHGIGAMSLMGNGGWGAASGEFLGTRPTHLDLYSKTLLGWATPTVISNDGSGRAYLVSSASSSSGYKGYRINTARDGEYFLVENRQFSGYDLGLQKFFTSGGIAIYHIDESILNSTDKTVNKLDGIKAEKAGLDPSLKVTEDITEAYINSLAKNAFWRRSATTQKIFDYDSVPNSNLNDTSKSGVRINILNVSKADMYISLNTPSFDIMNTVDSANSKIISVFRNNYAGTFYIRPIMAKYDSDGRLVQIKTYASDVATNNIDDKTNTAIVRKQTFGFSCDFSTSGKFKIIYLKGLEGMKPLASAETFVWNVK